VTDPGDDNLRLVVHEIYQSIQGESSFAGLPCTFVRTTGCPLRCSYCDTEHAFYEGRPMTIEQVIEKVLQYGCPLVEITGGEPLIQRNVLPLMTRLCDSGKTVLLETSGAFDIALVDERVHIIMDLKCPDSDEQQKNLLSNIEHLAAKDEVKFVLASRRDYEFARDAIAKHGLAERCAVLLSTVFGALEPKDVVDWMLEDKLQARFQLQMHKYIWPPEARGV
jgi:7-carboxy-7-deazaguanine synthase